MKINFALKMSGIPKAKKNKTRKNGMPTSASCGLVHEILSDIKKVGGSRISPLYRIKNSDEDFVTP